MRLALFLGAAASPSLGEGQGPEAGGGRGQGGKVSSADRKRKGRSPARVKGQWQEARQDGTGSGRSQTEGFRVNLTSFLYKLGFGFEA